MKKIKQHMIFDTEIIGRDNPRFLICCKCVETKKKYSFWMDDEEQIFKFEKLLLNPNYTWVGFNSENFDRPLIAAAVAGYDNEDLKVIAQYIIDEESKSWQTYRHFNLDFVDYDHIDLFEVAPGVQISLKTYAGRLQYPTMVDLPFHHDHDLTDEEAKIVEDYCFNDIGVTEQLFLSLKDELQLRAEMSEQYEIDLRSKSDAQVAEAILRKQCGIGKADNHMPRHVEYKAPDFIRTSNSVVLEILDLMQETFFDINRGNGQPIEPSWMEQPFKLNDGIYKVGLGGLHSQHDVKFYQEAWDDYCISDFDVASYYPNIIMKAGLIPNFGGNKGELFIEEYTKIYNARMEAKRAGNKRVANSLKIVLNGTYGKLGSIYSAFYAPDLMLGVTLTGQLNLLCLIADIEKTPGVKVLSANTDGIMVGYPTAKRDLVLKKIAANAKRTGFEYEETRYQTVAMKDVNNYIAITTDGKVKRKGLYASNDPVENPLYLMKNPTMCICSDAAVAWLKDGIDVQTYIENSKELAKFLEIRNVKGGGVQHKAFEILDDWELIEDHNSAKNLWQARATGKKEKRKSRPKPYEHGIGGEPFGRIARWYMTTENLPPITYVGSGNRVPSTEGSKLCLNLPKKMPKDLDIQWYVNETYRILTDLGVDTRS